MPQTITQAGPPLSTEALQANFPIRPSFMHQTPTNSVELRMSFADLPNTTRLQSIMIAGDKSHAPDPLIERSAKIMGMIFPRDWDGLGGKAITLQSCQSAVSFLRQAIDRGIPEPKFLSPSPLGAIAFQWNTPTHRLKVRVASDRSEGCHFEWIQLPDSSETGRGDIDSVVERLSRFFRKG
jgi:hypothetical protein